MPQPLYLPMSLMLLASAFALCGCGGSAGTKEEDPTAKADPPPEAVKRVSDTKLRPLVAEEALPPIDDGRLEVFPPKGWVHSAGSLDTLIYFKREKTLAKLPRILIKAEDVSAEMANSTEENVGEYKTWITKYLSDKIDHFTDKLLEPVKPMIIGDKACVRYVQKAVDPDGRPAERQVLITLHEGRLYTVFLDVEAKELTANRDQAYAVMATMKFREAAEPAVSPPAATPPAAPPPAAKK